MIDDPEQEECYHDPPAASIFIGRDETPYILCNCGHADDEIEGEFEVDWVRTDPWRGYGVVKPSKGSRWVEVHDDNILSMSEDEAQLKAFDDFLRESMDSAGIEDAREFAASSNVFSTGYTMFVERKFAKRVARLIEKMKPTHRDSYRYNFTALTGKDPKDAEPTDHTFALLAAAILGVRKR